MRVIWDADTMAYISAWLAEGQDVSQAYWNAETGIEVFSARMNGLPITMYLTGEDNFRYKVFPEYKAGRKNQPRPEHLQSVKDYLVQHHAARLSHGCEADDLCGIDQYQSNQQGEETILAHIDKDLDMIPGKHYNPAIVRNGIEVREEREYIISPKDALYNFYYQLLVGDSTDGIKGAAGIGKVKAKAILSDCETEEEFLSAVRDYFSCDEELLLNGQCLWIWREENGIWRIPD